ncbi:MAG: DUF1285 domain-containing protein [Rhodospirillales bacterium]|nr:DUF1285 domain-containing protein [Rhodospirillales bacterium]
MAENGPNLSNLSQGAEKNGPGPAGITPRPGQIVCGNIDMRIDNQGLWHYQGSPIGRIQLVKLFSTVLRRDDVGDHWLITPVEMCRIQVDDAAFMAVELTQTGSGQDQSLSFRTNIDKTYTLSDQYPLRIEINPTTDEPSPYIELDHGLEAKISRAVFYQLVDLGIAETVEQDHIYGVWSAGHFFPIGNAEDIEAS